MILVGINNNKAKYAMSKATVLNNVDHKNLKVDTRPEANLNVNRSLPSPLPQRPLLCQLSGFRDECLIS